MTWMTVCAVCGEVALPLPDWQPVVNADGSIQGTPCYCACIGDDPHSLAPRGYR